MTSFIRLTSTVALLGLAVASAQAQPAAKKQLIAHRGASGYAPEHTLEAYRLALTQGAEYLVTFDSDGQHLASEIALLVAPLQEGRADVALGTRFALGGTAVDISRKRALVLKLATMFSRRVTGLDITDTHNGFRGLTRSAAERLRITQNRMAHASQILEEIARLGLRYVEVPVTIRYTEYSLLKGQKLANGFNILWESMTEMFSR